MVPKYRRVQSKTPIAPEISKTCTFVKHLLHALNKKTTAGQSVVQMAENRSTRDQFALKFFLSEAAFIQERALYLDPSSPLGQFLPQLHTIPEGESALSDAEGNKMPSCIVMEKGESLETWAENSGLKLDMFTGLQVSIWSC